MTHKIDFWKFNVLTLLACNLRFIKFLQQRGSNRQIAHAKKIRWFSRILSNS